jgi:hypothetical protein
MHASFGPHTSTDLHSLVLEAGIFVFHLVWLLRTRKLRKHAKAQGKTFDDLAKEYAQTGIKFKFAERSFKISRVDIEMDNRVSKKTSDEMFGEQRQPRNSVFSSVRSSMHFSIVKHKIPRVTGAKTAGCSQKQYSTKNIEVVSYIGPSANN